MTYREETVVERAGAWDRSGRSVTRIVLDDPQPHPLNPDAWNYDPDTGVVVDDRGRQVGVDFEGRVHDEQGRELDAQGDPVALPDGTPLPPTPAAPPSTGVSHRRTSPSRVRHSPHSRQALARRFPILRDDRSVPRRKA